MTHDEANNHREDAQKELKAALTAAARAKAILTAAGTHARSTAAMVRDVEQVIADVMSFNAACIVGLG